MDRVTELERALYKANAKIAELEQEIMTAKGRFQLDDLSQSSLVQAIERESRVIGSRNIYDLCRQAFDQGADSMCDRLIEVANTQRLDKARILREKRMTKERFLEGRP